MIGAMRFYVLGNEIQPVERNEIGFLSTFDKRPNVMQLSAQTITLTGEDRDFIYNWIFNVQGRFENIPCQLVTDTGTYRYFIDISECVFTGTTTVECAIRPRGAFDDFWSKADNLSFEVVEALGGNTLSNTTVSHPYLIVKDDLAIQTITLSLTIYSLVMESYRTIKAIADLAGQVANVPFGTITATLQAIALTVYLFAIIASMISFIAKLVRLYFPKLRYLKAISDYDLVRLSCEYLGYQLQSNLLETIKDWYTLPIPLTRDNQRKSFFNFISDDLTNQTFNYGYPTVADTTPTLGSFIASIEDIFNAETVVYDNVVRIETRSFYIQNAVATIPDVFNVQERRESKWKFDTEQDWKRKILRWQIDYSDKHTTDNFDKTMTELSSEPIQFQQIDMLKIQGFKQFDFPFTPAKRKKELNGVEKLVKELFNIADAVIGAFGGSTSFATNIANRVGATMISEEVFSITKKLILGSDYRQKENYMDVLDPFNLYVNWHLDMKLDVNSGAIYDTMPIPCTEYEFKQFSLNKFVNLANTGKVIELIDAKFIYGQARAEITFKMYDNSGFNTRTQKIY